jgi:amino acid adenylation domain-containing protein
VRLEQHLLDSAERRPDAIALVANGEAVSYRDLAQRCRHLSSVILRREIGAGERVVVLLDNSIEAAVAFWSVLLAGAVVVPVNVSTKAEKLSWLIDHAGARAVITDERLHPVVADALCRSSQSVDRFVFDRDKHVAVVASDEHARRATDPRLGGDAGPDLAAIIYTSGSTGHAKGVMLTHHNMVSAAESIAQYLELRDDDIVHGIMPMSFDYGLYQLILSARQGARLVLAPPFSLPVQVLKHAEAEGVTFFPGVPTVYAMLESVAGSRTVPSVRAVTSTAAALTPRHIETIRRVFPNARIFSMYGITECKRCTYLPPADLDRKPGSVGIAIPNTELWLVDDQDRRLGPHQVGHLVIRGPTVMQGYWREPEESARRLRTHPVTGERVLYTHDLCRLDEEGYLYFVGRMDDIIKSRGEKVAPKEVEMAISAVPGVVEAAVIGVPDPIAGEAIQAFVVAADATELTEADLLRACREKLESFMVPKAIRIVSALPRSPNGKIDKLALRGQEHP